MYMYVFIQTVCVPCSKWMSVHCWPPTGSNVWPPLVWSWWPWWVGYLTSRRWLHIRTRHLWKFQPQQQPHPYQQSTSACHGGMWKIHLYMYSVHVVQYQFECMCSQQLCHMTWAPISYFSFFLCIEVNRRVWFEVRSRPYMYMNV